MILQYNKFAEYPDVINSYYDLERFDDGITDWALFQGYDASNNRIMRDKCKLISKRVYLNLEAPTAFCSTNNCIEQQKYFSHVYTLCPYTTDFMNKSNAVTKFYTIPFPYREQCFSPYSTDSKTYDVVYMGTAMCKEHIEIIEVMKDYKYNFISIYPDGNPTLLNVTSQKKWDVLSNTKVTIAMNLCPVGSNHKNWIKSNPNWEQIEAFNNLESGYIPQFKPRVIEAMRLNTLVLVRRDPWNVIEHWFEEGKHFLYWDDIEDLRSKLKQVLEHYDSYSGMIAEANKRVRDFEIDKIYHKMKNGEKVI